MCVFVVLKWLIMCDLGLVMSIVFCLKGVLLCCVVLCF